MGLQKSYIRKNLGERIATALRRHIRNRCRIGDRLDSIDDLARANQVSRATIGEALLILSKEGLVEKRHGSGTYVTDPAAQRHVAVLVNMDLSRPHTSYFWLKATQELRDYIAGRGFKVRVYLGSYGVEERQFTLTCPEFVEDLKADRISGIAELYGPDDTSWKEPLKQQCLPIVGRHQDGAMPVVLLDNAGMVTTATRYLLDQGRRHLAYLGLKHEWLPDPLYDAFVQTMAASGLTINPNWIRRDLHPSRGGAGWEEFREIWAAQQDKPDGLLVADDGFLQDAVTAILELGIKVPEQLLVVSHYNKGCGISVPFPLVRLELDPAEFAVAMGELLVRQLRQEPLSNPLRTITFRIDAGALQVHDAKGQVHDRSHRLPHTVAI